jgi:hypothetical protein
MTGFPTTSIVPAALSAVMALVISAAAIGFAASPASAPPDIIWHATTHFTAVEEPALARAYHETKAADPSLHGFAVDPMQFQDRFGAAEVRFNGPAATYTLILLAVAEEDGESVYRLAINGVDLPPRVNPTTAEKRKPVRHRWSGIALRPGDQIRVYFSGRSNRKIPERGGFAWSRGRWRLLEAFREAPPNKP